MCIAGFLNLVCFSSMFQKQSLNTTSRKVYKYGTEEKTLGDKIGLQKQNKIVEGTSGIRAPPARHKSP